nr:hypothetical protein [uncultured Oscillibacter sp.]
MEKGRLAGILALAVITAVTVGAEYPRMAAQQLEAAECQTLLETPVEGNAISPDGRYQLRQTDAGGDGEAVPSMETVQLVSADTGEVLWEESGDYETSALWSPEGTYVALSQRQRACGSVTVVETETFTSRQVPLPVDVESAEYAWISAEEWVDSDTLRIRCRDTREGGEGTLYRWSLCPEGELQAGTFLKETTEILPGNYDFDHDGVPETTELMTVGEPSGGSVAWYELHIAGGAGAADAPRPLFDGTLALQHPGWGSFIAVTVEGKDNFLMFAPVMYQGFATYWYELISFREDGSADLLDREEVSFDLSFGREGHQFDAEAIAGFFWKLRGILQNSTVLMSTENGEFQTGIPGLELQNYMFGDLLSLDSLEAMEAAVRQQEAERKAEQGAI